MMNKPHILITSATGTTGQAAIVSLLEKGFQIRAMVRVEDERSQALQAQGIEVVQGNFHDITSLRKALSGIKRAYFCYPFIDGLPKAATNFAKAAKENGVESIVSMSQMNVHEGSSSPATQNHLAAEDILDWADVGAIHIRPALFAWNYLTMAGPTVKAEGKFYFPNAEANYTIVHPQDIGDVISQLLTATDIDQHIGQRYDLAGTEIFTGQSLADTLSQQLKKEVSYIPIPVDLWIQNISQSPYINDFLAKHLEEFSKDIEGGLFNKLNDNIQQLTGHAPRSFSNYIDENITAFA